MSKLRLPIFAHHVATIALTDAPTEFTLHPFEGVSIHVRIDRPGIGQTDAQVYLDDQWCGNRWGGTVAYAQLVDDHTPKLDYSPE